MTLKQLRYLIAIVDSGLNITSAAERLYTSQPGISKQLKQLEAELGMQLFTRKGKSLAAVTPAGNEVIERARRVLREVENITSLSREITGEQSGTLSIATTHTQARYVLPEVIQAFAERYPNVNLELHQGTSEQIAELIDTHQVDFAIASGSLKLFGGLKVLPIYHWHRIALVPKDHPLARDKRALTLQKLATYPLVTYVFSLTGESSFKQAFQAEGLDPRVAFTARDADVIKTYVRRGMGVGVMASMAYECADQQDLKAIDAKGLFPSDHDLARLSEGHGAAQLHGRFHQPARAASVGALHPRGGERRDAGSFRRARRGDRAARARRLRGRLRGGCLASPRSPTAISRAEPVGSVHTRSPTSALRCAAVEQAGPSCQ